MFGRFEKIAVAAAAVLALAMAPTAPATALTAPVVKQLADDVYTMNVSLMRGFHFVSLVVVGEDGVLITDPAFTHRAQSMKAAIAGITDKPVTRIVLSHEHYDHVGGTEVFSEAQVICHASCQAVFDLDVSGQAPGKVDVTFADSLTVDFRGPTVNLHHFGPADGFGSTVVHVPEARVAFTADLYEDRSLTHGLWMEDDNYLAIRRVLRELQGMDLLHAVNSHSDDTSIRIVDENAAFVEDLFDLVGGAIGEAMEEGGPIQVFMSMSTWPQELKLPRYAGWRGYEEHFPAHVRRMALSIFHGG